MTLHILPPESTTVQNFKFRPSMVIELRVLNQRRRRRREEEEEEEEEDDEQCGKLHRLI